MLTRDLVAGGHVLSGDAHVDVQAGVMQRTQHVVQHLDVAHARAPTVGRGQVSATAHGLGTGADGHVAVTQLDGLGGRHDGLQARTAQAVHVESGGLLRYASVQGSHAADVSILRHGGDHVTHDNMPDFLGGDTSALQGGLDHQCAQVCRRHVLERATEAADGGTGCAHEDDFTSHVVFL